MRQEAAEALGGWERKHEKNQKKHYQRAATGGEKQHTKLTGEEELIRSLWKFADDKACHAQIDENWATKLVARRTMP